MSETQAPSLEEMFRRVKRGGYRINNLCHRLDGMWQANLRAARPGISFFEWGYGVDAAHALERALDKALSGKNVKGCTADADDMDPCVTGNTKDACAPIPAEELLGQPADVAEAPELVASTPAAVDEDDLIG